jgi:hypothetical protein
LAGAGGQRQHAFGVFLEQVSRGSMLWHPPPAMQLEDFFLKMDWICQAKN